MAVLVKVKVCSCVVATHSIHIKSVDVLIKNIALKTQRRVSNKNLSIELDSIIMGLRIGEGVLSCCPILYAWCAQCHMGQSGEETFSNEDHKDVHMNLVTVNACVSDFAVMWESRGFTAVSENKLKMTVCIAIIKCPIRSGFWGMTLNCHSGFSVWSPDTSGCRLKPSPLAKIKLRACRVYGVNCITFLYNSEGLH